MNKLYQQTVQNLQKNRFQVFEATNADHARELVLQEILPALKPTVVSYGDSLTVRATRVLESIRSLDTIEFIDTFEPGVERPEILRRRKQALAGDLFFTGTNAISAEGHLINLDMVGNRVGGIVFGPEHVIVMAGVNKLTPDTASAMQRVKTVAAPQNAKRHNCATPCVKTGECMDCRSPDRICNVWVLTERSHPRHRIKVVLINDTLGL